MSKLFANDILDCRRSVPATFQAVLLKTGLSSGVLITLCPFLPAAYTPAVLHRMIHRHRPESHEEVLTPFPDIVLQEKFQGSLRRQVATPFKGVITGLDSGPAKP